MSIAIVIPPYVEAIHKEEMKEHLKIEAAVTADDELIEALITAARDVAETGTGANARRHKVMLATTFDLKLNAFPAYSIYLSRVPLISVTSITYVDANGTTQTMSSSDYVADTLNSKIDLAYSEVWPTTRPDYNAVTVRFIAGIAASFTAATTDICTFQGRAFSVGDRVRLMNSGGALPAGLSSLTDYFVLALDKLSLTSGGGVVDITGTGTGTHFIGPTLAGFVELCGAVKLKTADLYYNRGDQTSGTIRMDNTDRVIDAICYANHA